MRVCPRLAAAILATLALVCSRSLSQETRNPSFGVGLRIVEFEYTYPDGRQRVMTTAVWYPTRAEPMAYAYPERVPTQRVQTMRAPRSALAFEAQPAAKDGPFPFVFFAHGAFGSATNSACFAEYLARNGFVVAAADFEDTIPPDFTRQLAFSRLGEGNVAPPMLILRVVRKFVDTFNSDRPKCLEYMTRFRWEPARFLIDRLLAENKDPTSPLHGVIDEQAIGMMGHSLGGLTTLGLIGPHPETHDKRVTAALIFSAPVYPLEGDLSKIEIPVLTMYGDNDPNALGPDCERCLLYQGIKAPRFEMVLRDANHFTFGNPRCHDLSTARQSRPQVRVIQDYGAAFFRRYLKGDESAEGVLSKTDPALVHYKCELRAGEEHIWGQPPPPKGDGSAGGIREEVRDRLRRSRRQQRPSTQR